MFVLDTSKVKQATPIPDNYPTTSCVYASTSGRMCLQSLHRTTGTASMVSALLTSFQSHAFARLKMLFPHPLALAFASKSPALSNSASASISRISFTVHSRSAVGAIVKWVPKILHIFSANRTHSAHATFGVKRFAFNPPSMHHRANLLQILIWAGSKVAISTSLFANTTMLFVYTKLSHHLPSSFKSSSSFLRIVSSRFTTRLALGAP